MLVLYYNTFILWFCYNLGKYSSFKETLYAELITIAVFLPLFIVIFRACKKEKVIQTKSKILTNKPLLFLLGGFNAFLISHFIEKKK